MSQITSEEVNYLVYRYLQEAGFTHSSFTFGQESFVSRSEIKPEAVPPGMLVGLLQKGLQYTSIEFHLNEDGSEKECTKAWSLLAPHVCEVKQQLAPQATSSSAIKAKKSLTINMEEAMTAAKKRKKEGVGKKGVTASMSMENVVVSSSSMDSERFVESEVITLTGHESEVIGCAWCPDRSRGLLASVAGDDTCRIWPLPFGEALDPEHIIGHELVLMHGEGQSKEVTTLDWSPDGAFLATGCYDGRARVWTAEGGLHAALGGIRGPLFALRWSPSGKYLAGAGLEIAAAVWDPLVSAEVPVRVWSNHASPTLDLDWRDDGRLATCTTDKNIYVYDVDKEEPIVCFSGQHTDEINSVRWSPDGILLASASDDGTARIWCPDEPDKPPLLLLGHEKEIYCLKWAPTGPASPNPSLPPLLATASFDQTVRLWDPQAGTCLHTLRRHTDSVYAISFSPDGRFLASGSLDESLCVWAVPEGTLMRVWEGGRGGIFELAWSPAGERLAACTSDSTVPQLVVLIVC